MYDRIEASRTFRPEWLVAGSDDPAEKRYRDWREGKEEF
jgi:hypothetical protein